MKFIILFISFPLFVLAQNNAPVADAASISGQPTVVRVGQTQQIEAQFSDADGSGDIKTCRLRLNHPQYPLTMEYDVQSGVATAWAGTQGSDFLSPVSVVRQNLPDGNSFVLRWQFFVHYGWPTTGSGVDFQLQVEDQSGATDGWNSDGSDLAADLPQYGTTIIAHGYQFLATAPPDWVRTMGLAIGNRLGNARVRQLNPASGQFELISGGTIGSDADWEEVLIVDWADESDINTQGFSEAAADAFVAALLKHQIDNPSPHFLDRIHLIGHSRGTVIISEMGERLLALRDAQATEKFNFNGTLADELTLTFLDTHPVWGDAVSNNIDVDKVNPGSEERDQVLAWEGLTLGENYYQPISSSPHFLNPDGLPVYSAWNRNLDETILNSQGANNQLEHSDVHAWYHGTIDPEASDDQLAAMIAEEQQNISGQSLQKTAISINRSLWYTDGIGLAEGFAHCNHGGAVPFADSLATLDPTTPQSPFYNYKSDAFFDGNFTYSGADVTNGGYPAWEYQGGGGSGSIADQQLTLTATQGGGNRDRTHNYFYLSNQATSIQFACRLVSSADATLQLFIDNTELDSWPLSGLSASQQLAAGIPSSLIGGTHSVQFNLSGSPGTAAEVQIDDIEVVFETQSLDLLTPDGGENWITGNQEHILWTRQGAFAHFALWYQTSVSGSWQLIDDQVSGDSTSYLWTVPDVTSSECRVKISGYFDSQSLTDSSSAPFTISGPSKIIGQSTKVTDWRLWPAWPNPFNPAINISYQVARQKNVQLVVYNVLGQKIATLVNRRQKAGKYTLSWQPQNLSAGIYFMHINAGNWKAVQKIIYLP